MITPASIYAAVDGTWPAVKMHSHGPWILREGQGGGKRVSAATATDAPGAGDIAAAENAMRALGQTPLFMIRGADATLDSILADQGYNVVDPVNVYLADTGLLTDQPIPPVTAFAIWEPLAIMTDIWAKGEIGKSRLDVMHRANKKTAILARWNEKPAGTAFVAIHDGIAMVHAVEVLQHQRRQGVANWIMRAAGHWAAQNDADHIAVLCTHANTAANMLYQRLGFRKRCGYHYRQKPEST